MDRRTSKEKMFDIAVDISRLLDIPPPGVNTPIDLYTFVAFHALTRRLVAIEEQMLEQSVADLKVDEDALAELEQKLCDET